METRLTRELLMFAIGGAVAFVAQLLTTKAISSFWSAEVVGRYVMVQALLSFANSVLIGPFLVCHLRWAVHNVSGCRGLGWRGHSVIGVVLGTIAGCLLLAVVVIRRESVSAQWIVVGIVILIGNAIGGLVTNGMEANGKAEGLASGLCISRVVALLAVCILGSVHPEASPWAISASTGLTVSAVLLMFGGSALSMSGASGHEPIGMWKSGRSFVTSIGYQWIYHCMSYSTSWLLTTSDRVFLVDALGEGEVGRYGINYAILSAPLVVVNSALEYASRRLMYRSSDGSGAFDALKKRIVLAVLSGVAWLIIIMPFYETVIVLVTSPRFVVSRVVVFALVVANVLMLASNGFTTHLLGRRKDATVAVIGIVSGGFVLIANVALIPQFGMVGAALATVVGYGTALLGQLAAIALDRNQVQVRHV